MVDKLDEIDSYYLIKGRFKGIETNAFGLFIIFFSAAQKRIENVEVAASHFSSIYETLPSLDWSAFDEKITQLKWKGEISVNSSRELQLLLSNSIRPDIIEELIDAIKANQNNKIDHTLLSIFVKGLGDKSVALDFKTQKIAHAEIIKAKDERARREKEEREVQEREAMRDAEKNRFKVEEGAIILPVNLVLGPVNGIPIFDVKEKDAIMIKIDASSDKGNYFIDLLQARSAEGAIMGIKGVIKEVFMNALGEFELLTEIGPGIYGRTIETEKVKIKQFFASE